MVLFCFPQLSHNRIEHRDPSKHKTLRDRGLLGSWEFAGALEKVLDVTGYTAGDCVNLILLRYQRSERHQVTSQAIFNEKKLCSRPWKRSKDQALSLTP